MNSHVSPLEGKTTNWRAGCGRSASPVRREGEQKPIGSPYPYHKPRLTMGSVISPDVTALAYGPRTAIRIKSVHSVVNRAGWLPG
jgi:hypothetical protein